MAEDLSAHLDGAWGAEETEYEAPDGSTVYKDRNGDLFYLRRRGENGNEIGREAFQPHGRKKEKT